LGVDEYEAGQIERLSMLVGAFLGHSQVVLDSLNSNFRRLGWQS
jgi:hypothetical protein